MEPDGLLLLARELINDLTFCFTITCAEHGETHARIVQPRKPTKGATSTRRGGWIREDSGSRRITALDDS